MRFTYKTLQEFHLPTLVAQTLGAPYLKPILARKSSPEVGTAQAHNLVQATMAQVACRSGGRRALDTQPPKHTCKARKWCGSAFCDTSDQTM